MRYLVRMVIDRLVGDTLFKDEDISVPRGTYDTLEEARSILLTSTTQQTRPHEDPVVEGYLARPGECPYCHSGDLEGEDPEMMGNDRTTRMEVSCNICHARWDDIYTLSGIEVIHQPVYASYPPS